MKKYLQLYLKKNINLFLGFFLIINLGLSSYSDLYAFNDITIINHLNGELESQSIDLKIVPADYLIYGSQINKIGQPLKLFTHKVFNLQQCTDENILKSIHNFPSKLDPLVLLPTKLILLNFFEDKKLDSLISNQENINAYVFPNSNFYYWGQAFDFASKFSQDGYSDWHLPSREEMISLITKFGLGIFPSNGSYWTSSGYTGGLGYPTSNSSAYQPLVFSIGGTDSGATIFTQVNQYAYSNYYGLVNPDKAMIILVR